MCCQLVKNLSYIVEVKTVLPAADFSSDILRENAGGGIGNASQMLS